MATAPDPVDTIERFAALSARLEDPFADEAGVLSAAGLDEAAWDAVQERWARRISTTSPDEARALSARFGEAFAEEKRRLEAADRPPSTIPDTWPDGAGFLSAEAQPWRAEAASVGREPSAAPAMVITAPDREPVSPRRLGVAETLESPGPLPLPVLPFAPAPAPRADSPDATLELGAVLPIAALPFRRNNQ